MAAQPKKKISKVRGKTRRGHYKVSLPHVVVDKATGTARLPHRIAPDTGIYNGRTAVKTKMTKQLERKLAASARAEKAAAKKAAKAKTSETKPKTAKPTTKKTETKAKSEKKDEKQSPPQ